MKLRITVLIVALLPLTSFAENSMSQVTAEIERINTIRESLVGVVQGNVTKDTFTSVCKPVGEQLKAFAKKQGVQVNQPTFKYRNSKHKPNAIEGVALKKMEDDPQLISYWQEAKGGRYYFRRIPVKKACLNCHGPKASRPSFINSKYPKDKAFDFKVGDLRAIYSVFVPEL